jgi:hypothetical protein
VRNIVAFAASFFDVLSKVLQTFCWSDIPEVNQALDSLNYFRSVVASGHLSSDWVVGSL